MGASGGGGRAPAVSGRPWGCGGDTARGRGPLCSPPGPPPAGAGRSAPPSAPWAGGRDPPALGARASGRPSGALTASSRAAHGLPGEQRREGHVRVQRAALLLPAHALRLPVSDRGPCRAPETGGGGWALGWRAGKGRGPRRAGTGVPPRLDTPHTPCLGRPAAPASLPGFGCRPGPGPGTGRRLLLAAPARAWLPGLWGDPGPRSH